MMNILPHTKNGMQSISQQNPQQTRGQLPSTVILSFSTPNNRVDLKRDAGLTVPIDPDTGAFNVDGVYNSITGGDNPFGFIYAGVQNPDGITYGLSTAELDG